MNHVQILVALFTFELLYRGLSVINCEEGDQFLIVLDVLICNLNRCLKVQDIAFLAFV